MTFAENSDANRQDGAVTGRNKESISEVLRLFFIAIILCRRYAVARLSSNTLDLFVGGSASVEGALAHTFIGS